MKFDYPPELLWLEAKTVCYGGKSSIFPDLTEAKAKAIRTMGLDKLRQVMCEANESECKECTNENRIDCLTKEGMPMDK